ncbi:hypothetical protein T484DRAFT_1620185, partial [Baffinella frigidus]
MIVKGPRDVISDGTETISCGAEGSPRRAGGQGRLPTILHPASSQRRWLLLACNQPATHPGCACRGRLPAYHPAPSIQHSLSTIHHPPSTMHYPQSTIHNPPPTIHHPPSTLNPPPSTIHHPPSTLHPPPS